ncbi:MAG TPA: hypothetical protein VF360_00175 [Candidatus Methanoperedens sp.]
MKKIASHAAIEIYAPDKSRFSFLKSPYAAHKTNSAVDIYDGSFGGSAVSPVDGKIIDIRSYDTPTPFKNIDSKEYLIALEQGNHVIKILHIKPDVSIGEKISRGDRIGAFIKNGYFIFWNDPVMHVEVRKPHDYLRASNNLNLIPAIDWNRVSAPIPEVMDFECRVEDINEHYSLLFAPYRTCGEVMGFSVDGGFIDGYVSSYQDDFFGVIKPGGFARPKLTQLEITSDGSKIKCGGIAFCLAFNEPRIKVIPQRYGEKPFSKGDEVRIRLGIQ